MWIHGALTIASTETIIIQPSCRRPIHRWIYFKSDKKNSLSVFISELKANYNNIGPTRRGLPCYCKLSRDTDHWF